MPVTVEHARALEHGVAQGGGPSVARMAKDAAAVDAVCDVLGDGGVVLAHTDLGYLLCADALDRSAIGRVTRMRRPPAHRLGVVVDPDEAHRYAVLGRRARRLMLETWPGTLALRLPRRRSLPSWAAQDEAATLLCPDGFCWRVAWAFGAPIAVVLAGAHGSSESRRPVGAPGVDLIVDGGLAACAPATILDLTSVRPRVASSGTLFAPQRLRRLVPDL